MRPRLNVYGDHRLAEIHVRFEAVAAQLQAELVFTFRAKTPVALMAGRNFLVLRLFAGVNLGMDFDHLETPPNLHRANALPDNRIEGKALTTRWIR